MEAHIFPWLRQFVIGTVLFHCLCSQALALDAAALQSVVIVEGDKGRGSAFVVRMNGKVYLVSNAHVIRGNSNLRFKNLANEQLMVGPLEIAGEADLVRAELSSPAPGNVLELVEKVQDEITIGNEVVVAGNSEGAGVVRELAGKVTGIGPDRIEVDAGFVPGNSGSPILLKATGKVIGVATYARIPPWLRYNAQSGVRSPLSLNEVRRFGYRLDTVEKWDRPDEPDQLVQQGAKLVQLDMIASAFFEAARAGGGNLIRFGSANYVSKAQAAEAPALADLAKAIDEFAKENRGTTKPADRQKSFVKYIAGYKAALLASAAGLSEGNFTGWFAGQFGEHLAWQKRMLSWVESNEEAAAKNSWEGAGDLAYADLSLDLSTEQDSSGPPDRRHSAFYANQQRPPSYDYLYWVVITPQRETNASPMTGTRFRASTPVNGTYRVRAEYRRGEVTRVVSDEVAFEVTGTTPVVTAAPPADNDTQAMFYRTDPWTGEIMLPPGRYQQTARLLVGRPEPRAPARVFSVPKTEITHIKEGEIRILAGEWQADGTLFRNARIQGLANTLFFAKNSLFDGSKMSHTGPTPNSLYATKLFFTNCVFIRSFVPMWKVADDGVRAENCTFYSIGFPGIGYKKDAASEARNEWHGLRNCYFVGCTIPESLLIATENCVFDNCKFGLPDERIAHTRPIKVRIYLTNRDEIPVLGRGRTVEILDAAKLTTPTGATVPHIKFGLNLNFK